MPFVFCKRIITHFKYIFFKKTIFNIKPSLIKISSVSFFYMLSLLFNFPNTIKKLKFKKFHKYSKDITPINIKNNDDCFVNVNFFINKNWKTNTYSSIEINSRGLLFKKGRFLPDNFSNMETLYFYMGENISEKIYSITSLFRETLRITFFRKVRYKKAFFVTDLHGHSYFHWITEVVPRIVLFEKKRETILLLPEIARGVSYIAETLNILNVKYEFIESFTKAFVYELYFPEFRAGTFSYVKSDMLHIKSLFLDGSLDSTPIDLLYISREDADKRKIINEKEFIEYIHRIGGVVIKCSEMTIKQQASYLSRSRILVSPHGAGLTNMIFMIKDSTVIEIVSKKGLTNICFVKLAHVLGLKYLYFRTESKKNFSFTKDSTHYRNFKIDIKKFDKLLSEYKLKNN